MANDGSVVIYVDFDTSSVPRAQRTVESAVGKMESALKSLAKVAASAFAFSKLIDFGKQAIDLASDLDETQNVVDTAFGDMTDMVEAFADTAIEKLGLSRLAAKQMASTYMAMGKGIGVADEASAQMAINATARAADIMSFYNLTADRANTMMKSIWTGETESFKAIGVVMSEANLQNFAYQNGINKKISAMTEAEKVQLRYNYVMAQTALADGDFAKTSGSWANQVRMLSEKFKELMSILGTGLVQVLLPIVQALNTIVSRLITMAQTLSSVFGGKITQETEAIASKQEEYASAVSDTTKETKKANKAAKSASASFDTLNVLSTSDSSESTSSEGSGSSGVSVNSGAGLDLSPLELSVDINASEEGMSTLESIKVLATTIGTILAGWTVGNLLSQLPTLIGELVKTKDASNLTSSLKSTAGTLMIIAGVAATIIGYSDAWVNGVDWGNFALILGGIALTVGGLALVFGTMGAVIGVIVGSIAAFVLGIKDILTNGATLQNVLLVIIGILGIFAATLYIANLPIALIVAAVLGIIAVFVILWNKSETFRNFWIELWEKIKEMAVGAWEKLKEIGASIADIFLDLWENHLKPFWEDHVEPMIDAIKKWASDLWENTIKPILKNIGGKLQALWDDVLTPVCNFIKKVFVEAFKTAFDMIKTQVETVVEGISGVIDGIKTTLAGVCDFITGVFSGDWKKALDGLKDVLRGVVNGIISLFESMINFVVRPLNTFLQKISDAANKLGDLIGQNWNINLTFSEVKIPRLATGAVIPPNREFLAVLGDQKSGTNIEAPLDTMVQAFKAAASEIGGGQDINVTFSGNEGQLLRYLYKGIKVTGKKRGVAMVK